ncbi:hypothetical protein SAMN05444274_1044 [Mariniphaga anaerophila]|uniref:Uncharacterized protein n=1 Tax=Mariniphaga anaerophila TaxID=1484053 RepID=A0A1M4ZNI1_9BACT|nr:hypothetical protein [Mariniphaga anaerophila]SHF19558.1 hypothetical protein SAMN05444274_1044 [Mariniphaga anaerophila]
MSKDFKMTLRFVVLIATPLCLVNSLIVSFGSSDFLFDLFSRFGFNYAVTFPQAIFYVSVVKWFDKKKKS